MAFACVAAALIVLPACPRVVPPAPTGVELAQSFVARASGEVEVNDLVFYGHARASYMVTPDGEVDIRRLRFWIDDADIVVRGPLGAERARERLRCTFLEIESAAKGRTGAAGRLVISSGDVSITGTSHDERGERGECPALARQITATNNADFELIHVPASDRFGLSTTFTGTLGEESVTVRIDMDGSYVNRPPQPLIGVGGPGLPPGSIQGGCPPIVAGNPPYTPANDPEGLRVNLLSLASDPDGSTGRSDVVGEYWLHLSGTERRYLGGRQLVGPVLFATGSEHRLVLEVSDRHGALARTVCDFLVLEDPGGSG